MLAGNAEARNTCTLLIIEWQFFFLEFTDLHQDDAYIQGDSMEARTQDVFLSWALLHPAYV